MAELQRAAQRGDPRVDARERDRGEPPRGRQRHELQRGARDHAERALGADEQLRQLRSHRVPRDLDRLHQPARRRRDAQRQHEILDLAVAGREHAGAAGGDVAADRRPLDRRGVVRQHQPACVELGLEVAPVLAGLDGDRHRLLVDFDHRVERAEVDHDAAVDGQCTALRARSAAPRDDRHAPLGGDRQHGGYVLLGAGPHDHVRPRDWRSCGLCVQGGPVGVRRVGVQLGRPPL